MKILGIESSCDETAAAVVEDGTGILSNIISSQVELHSRYGGIVPEVASRQHLLSSVPVLERALEEAGASPNDIDAIAVTNGPGLAGSLLVGVNLAKALALAWELPLIGINHLEAHIYANWLGHETPVFPLIALIVSGGHTDLVLMKGHGDIIRLGQTRDDAAGEAFDKVARVLGLGYPGGPAIEQASKEGSPSYRLPRAWIKGSDDFSFSGPKTAVVRLARELSLANTPARNSVPADIAASFQQSVVDVLVTKTSAAANRHHVRQILLAGGVAANELLRQTMVDRSPIPVLIPEPVLCTDNAAMVASCGCFHLLRGKVDGWDLDVAPGLTLGQI
ncbi:MAG: tRNA (adenosine(37)-N6)-threonylcarbamoyltransferase complex transferase subunit TsaD [Dehalococcoidia bacterium]|nr:MAG: tRNA (adenosine(37)-N6)-threonylcarbamoyltransferase complex transferase subunit TsaD [Dehalococcoidia bacterium]